MSRALIGRILSCIVAEGGRPRVSAFFPLQPLRFPACSAPGARFANPLCTLLPPVSTNVTRQEKSITPPWYALVHSDTQSLRYCSQHQLRIAVTGRIGHSSLAAHSRQNHHQGDGGSSRAGIPELGTVAVGSLLVGLIANNSSLCEKSTDQQAIVERGPAMKIVYQHDVSWLEDLLIDIKCCVMMCLFTILGPIVSLGWTLLSWSQMAVFWAVYLTSVLMPPYFSKEFQKNPYVGGRLVKEVTGYLKPFTMIKEADLDPSVPYIFGYHPHGRGLPLGQASMFAEIYRWFPEIDAAGKCVFSAGTDLLFAVPVLGLWMRAIGAIPVNRRSIVSKLKQGHSVVIAIGGIDEVLVGTFDDKDVLFLDSRKGFCKVAIETQSGLVPVFCFGENAMFEHSWPITLNAWKWINQHIARLGAPFPMVGRFGLPIMHRRPMTIVFGEPLYPREGETPSQLHGRYVQALCNLYKRHVGDTAYSHKRLVIV